MSHFQRIWKRKSGYRRDRPLFFRLNNPLEVGAEPLPGKAMERIWKRKSGYRRDRPLFFRLNNPLEVGAEPSPGKAMRCCKTGYTTLEAVLKFAGG